MNSHSYARAIRSWRGSGSRIAAHQLVDDRSFTLEIRAPTTASLLVHAAGIPKGATAPNGVAVGSITREQLRAIATTKQAEMNAIDVEGAERMMAGTARSMGIAIRD